MAKGVDSYFTKGGHSATEDDGHFGIKVKSIQIPGTEAIRTQIQPSKPKHLKYNNIEP